MKFAESSQWQRLGGAGGSAMKLRWYANAVRPDHAQSSRLGLASPTARLGYAAVGTSTLCGSPIGVKSDAEPASA